jgi:hypothetical protein
MNEFDQWRERYDKMTIDEQIAYHNELEARYPEQNHYNYDKVKEALCLVKPNFTVLEFGTWKGDLAKQAFKDFSIIDWYGIEICESAIKSTKCDKVKYIKPTRFDWFNDKRTIKADVIIATHFIEHLSNDHFKQLANYCKGVKYIHFESPLTDEGNEWDGYEGTHKLTIGWNKINDIMKENGYKLIINHPESKTYGYNNPA